MNGVCLPRRHSLEDRILSPVRTVFLQTSCFRGCAEDAVQLHFRYVSQQTKRDMSSFTEGQIHQLADALEDAGFTSEDLTRLGQDKNGILHSLRGVIRGMHEITQVDLPQPPVLRSNLFIGSAWVSLLRDHGMIVTGPAEDILTRDEFDEEHVTGGCKYEPTLIHGDEFNGDERTTKNTHRRLGIDKRGLFEPPAELAPLLAKELTAKYLKLLEEEYGISSLVISHKPIEDSDSNPYLLHVDYSGVAVRLDASRSDIVNHWNSQDGFQDGFVFLSHIL